MLEAIDLDSVQARGYAFQIEITYRALRRILAEAVWKVPRLRFGRDHVELSPIDLPDSRGEEKQGAILSEVLSDEPQIRESDIQ